MKTLVFLGSVVSATLLAACSTLASTADVDNIDHERVAQVEQKALKNFAQVLWVQMPRKTPASDASPTPQ